MAKRKPAKPTKNTILIDIDTVIILDTIGRAGAVPKDAVRLNTFGPDGAMSLDDLISSIMGGGSDKSN